MQPGNPQNTCVSKSLTPMVLIVAAMALAHSVVGIRAVLVPIMTAIVFTVAAIVVLILACRLDARRPLAAAGLIAAFMATDLAWNKTPHNSTALPPVQFEALSPDSSK